MDKNGLLNRRSVLLGLAPAALGAAGLTGCSTNSRSASGDYVPTFFTAGEWAFIRAAVARLIPSDPPGPGALEAGVPEFIDRQMELPYGHGAYYYLKGPFKPDSAPTLGYQLKHTPRDIYRLGIADANSALRGQKGRDFASLEAADQDLALQVMEKGGLHLPSVPEAVLFEQLLANTKEGYFADPIYGGNRDMIAWKWIGFPGARADFTDWIAQPGRSYPYGPVSIGGKQV